MNQSIKELTIIFNENANLVKKVQMEKYLLNQFPFIGLQKPERSLLEKNFIDNLKKESVKKKLVLIKKLHLKKEREYMYTAQQIALKYYREFTYEDLWTMIQLIQEKGWWENCDGYNSIVLRYLKLHEAEIPQLIYALNKSDNLWMRRMSIICQLTLKEKTNVQMLDWAIQNNFNNNDFFIQKAIGWALRDYYRFDPEFVVKYIEQNNFSKLVVREALKHHQK